MREQLKEIKVIFVCPPIPIRQYDYCAYYDGEEELGHYGYGRTKGEAIEALLERHQD